MTTTDPRAAALAEALPIVTIGWEPGDMTPMEAAALALADLPPDWCGHEAEIKRLREALNGLRSTADAVIRHYVGMTPDEPLLSQADIVALREAYVRAALGDEA
jgi:hypothetical protein